MADQIYYRNRNQVSIKTKTGKVILDPDCLWVLIIKKLVLYDDDQYITLDFEQNKDHFYPVPEPDELKEH